MKDITGKKLQKILNNNTSGSSELLLLLNEYFQNYIDDFDNLRNTYLLAKKWFVDFAAIQDYLKCIKPFITDGDLNNLKDFTKSFEESFNARYDFIFNNALPYLSDAKRIITLSNSETLYEILKRLKAKQDFQLFIAESRPKAEGKLLAKKLLKYDIKVELLTDAMLAYYFPKVDAAIIGCDKILSNGDVVNKTGSRNLAIIANYFKKPFYVICDKTKYTDETEYNPQFHPPDEIWKYKHSDLTINNYYFETVESSLITKIITD